MLRSLEKLLIGKALAGRYLLEEVLGRGGMSIVYRGLDRTLGRPVAVKIIHLEEGSEGAREQLRRRFHREAASAAGIPPHPNVVRIYDFGADDELELDFLVMELLQGRDLKQALREDPPSPAESVRILLEAARGVAAGHGAGIVHRDIKPANIFLLENQSSEIRVLDFGIAKGLADDPDDDLTMAGQAPHSPSYAAPEQLDPDRPVSAATDVYQLGLVGYELLAGTRPFSDEQKERLRAGEPLAVPVRGRWETVDPGVRRVIERALRPDPAERYPDATAFLNALAARDEDDDTRLMPLPQSPETASIERHEGIEEEGTVLLTPEPITSPATAGTPLRVEEERAKKPAAVRQQSFPIKRSGAAWVGAALLLVLLLWAGTRLFNPSADSANSPAGQAVVDPAEQIFRDLESQAARRVEESGDPLP